MFPSMSKGEIVCNLAKWISWSCHLSQHISSIKKTDLEDEDLQVRLRKLSKYQLNYLAEQIKV